jgi:nucleolar protein 15
MTVENEAAVQSPKTERVPRKRRAPDTSHLNTPKVIAGGAVVLISRLPHGFHETELRSYLSQFGEVTRLRLSRNPRTSASRHYAFVEFRHAEVAVIVVETMHNYLLLGHLLQCQLLAEEKVHPELWKGANRKFVHIPWNKMHAKRFNATMEKMQPEQAIEAARKSKDHSRQKCQAAGIQYDCENILTGDL